MLYLPFLNHLFRHISFVAQRTFTTSTAICTSFATQAAILSAVIGARAITPVSIYRISYQELSNSIVGEFIRLFLCVRITGAYNPNDKEDKIDQSPQNGLQAGTRFRYRGWWIKHYKS